MSVSKSKRRLVERLRQPKSRAREGRVLVEGPRPVQELLRARGRIEWAVLGESLASNEDGVVSMLESAGVEIEVVGEREFRELADTVSPQQVLAVAREPEATQVEALLPGRILCTDRIQDPGNLGTLLRTAWALGLEGVCVLSGSADPWSTKVVRASAGGVFHVPLARASVQELISVAASTGTALYCASPSGEDVTDLAVPSAWILVVGNESAGVSDELMAAGRSVGIPLAAGVDSLNAAVAGSILMYELSAPRSVARHTDPTHGETSAP